ncbi:MAG: DUF411 domain-containing protein [Patescibacteria group bacterium]
MNSKKYFKPIILGIGIAALITIAAITSTNKTNQTDRANKHLTLYKSPNCGCCANHAAYLRRNDFEVEIIETNDMDAIKSENGIPGGEESCHTSVIDGYAIEGHMPVEAIEKLLAEKPDIKGIGLAEMPSGSPGMPGAKKEPFDIYSFTEDGKVNNYLKL